MLISFELTDRFEITDRQRDNPFLLSFPPYLLMETFLE
jgi:hypothetical protein